MFLQQSLQDETRKNSENYKTFSLKKRKQSFVRGEQIIPPSGHLAPTIQIKNGKVYPVAEGVDILEREARKTDHPEEVAEWFIWLYQWSEKDPITNLWRTKSVYVPAHLVSTIKYMISAEKPISEILNFIEQNKAKNQRKKSKRPTTKVQSKRKKQKDKNRSP